MWVSQNKMPPACRRAMANCSVPAERSGIEVVHCVGGCSDSDMRGALRTIRRPPHPAVRLICFPYAGVGPSIFNKWAPLLHDEVDLIGVMYSGREDRVNERPSRSITEIVDAVAEELAEYDDLPTALFGHSMGAYVCYELTGVLSKSRRTPHHIFLSAARAPHVPGAPRIYDLPDEEFAEALVALNGIPAEVRNDRELLQYALPILRADFMVCETHNFRPAAPIRCPVSVYGGASDARVSKRELSAWKDLAAMSCDVRIFEGDHFYLRERQTELLGCINEELARLV